MYIFPEKEELATSLNYHKRFNIILTSKVKEMIFLATSSNVNACESIYLVWLQQAAL